MPASSCAKCDKPIITGPTSSDTPMCRSCRTGSGAGRRPNQGITSWGTCSRCGKRVRVTAATSADQPVCRPCRQPDADGFICQSCDQPFTPKNYRPGRTPKACSRACVAALRQGAKRVPQPCTDCRTVTVSSTKVPLCPPCRADRRIERYRKKNHVRRATLQAVASEPYTLAWLALRDVFTCKLCGESVDMTLKTPDPGSPSIDHVLPLSLGGDDTRANVQLAHRRCNERKGARLQEQAV